MSLILLIPFLREAVSTTELKRATLAIKHMFDSSVLFCIKTSNLSVLHFTALRSLLVWDIAVIHFHTIQLGILLRTFYNDATDILSQNSTPA